MAADQPSNAQPSAASADAEESEPAERPAPQGETRQTSSRVTPHAQRAAEAPAAPIRVTRSCRGRVAAEAEGPAADLQQVPLSQAFPSPPRVRGRRGKKAQPAKEASPVPAAAAEVPAQLEVAPAQQDSAGAEDMEVAEPPSMQQEGETEVTLHGRQLAGTAGFVHSAAYKGIIEVQLQVSCAWLPLYRGLAFARAHCALCHSAVLQACRGCKACASTRAIMHGQAQECLSVQHHQLGLICRAIAPFPRLSSTELSKPLLGLQEQEASPATAQPAAVPSSLPRQTRSAASPTPGPTADQQALEAVPSSSLITPSAAGAAGSDQSAGPSTSGSRKRGRPATMPKSRLGPSSKKAKISPQGAEGNAALASAADRYAATQAEAGPIAEAGQATTGIVDATHVTQAPAGSVARSTRRQLKHQQTLEGLALPAEVQASGSVRATPATRAAAATVIPSSTGQHTTRRAAAAVAKGLADAAEAMAPASAGSQELQHPAPSTHTLGESDAT